MAVISPVWRLAAANGWLAKCGGSGWPGVAYVLYLINQWRKRHQPVMSA